ncbi:MAG: hypothetical protein DRH11_16055 [Deltaproteobacteria bacterium]|nr:MAG: hypothetical protein DRH11_16055 [Deltaproteobacteria bacterium]
MEPIEKQKIIVVDDHDYSRQSLVAFLREVPGIDVLGEASDGIEAVKTAERLSPDVVVMDIRMPGQSGIEAARKIRQKVPSTKVILYSMYGGEFYTRQDLSIADRFIPKERLFEEILGALSELEPGE